MEQWGSPWILTLLSSLFSWGCSIPDRFFPSSCDKWGFLDSRRHNHLSFHGTLSQWCSERKFFVWLSLWIFSYFLAFIRLKFIKQYSDSIPFLVGLEHVPLFLQFTQALRWVSQWMLSAQIKAKVTSKTQMRRVWVDTTQMHTHNLLVHSNSLEAHFLS